MKRIIVLCLALVVALTLGVSGADAGRFKITITASSSSEPETTLGQSAIAVGEVVSKSATDNGNGTVTFECHVTAHASVDKQVPYAESKADCSASVSWTISGTWEPANENDTPNGTSDVDCDYKCSVYAWHNTGWPNEITAKSRGGIQYVAEDGNSGILQFGWQEDIHHQGQGTMGAPWFFGPAGVGDSPTYVKDLTELNFQAQGGTQVGANVIAYGHRK